MTTSNRNPYKILALDGGGFRGVMTAQILIEVEKKIRDKHGCALHEYFDLVTGTSTGSLLAAGIALGKTAQELLDLYKNEGDKIFPKSKRFQRNFRFLSRNIPFIASDILYDNHTGLGQVLKDVFGEKTIGEILPDSTSQNNRTGLPVLVIPAYNLSERRVTWFCNNNPKTARAPYDDIPVWQICVCSSAAPTFFPPYELTYKHSDGKQEIVPFIDGGVAVNNPTLLGIAHALYLPYRDAVEEKLDFNLDDFAVLSIGTGEYIEPYTYKQVKNWGALQWATRLPDLFIPAPNDVTADIAWQIIRQENEENAQRCLRLDYALPSQDQYQNYPALKNIPVIAEAFQKKQFGSIDNPEMFDAYQAFANCYLDGKLRKKEIKTLTSLGGLTQKERETLSPDVIAKLEATKNERTITPREAIARFIENNGYVKETRPLPASKQQ